jgi:tetratricopeptide (TPR) repeat protein
MNHRTRAGLAILLVAPALAGAEVPSRYRWERSDRARYKVFLEEGREVSRHEFPPRDIPWIGPRGKAIEQMIEGAEDLLGEGSVEDAGLLLAEALEQIQELGESALGLAEADLVLSEVHLARGASEDAIQSLLRVLAVRSQAHGVGAPELIDPLERLAKIYLDIPRLVESRRVLEWLRAVRLRRPNELRALSKLPPRKRWMKKVRERVEEREAAAKPPPLSEWTSPEEVARVSQPPPISEWTSPEDVAPPPALAAHPAPSPAPEPVQNPVPKAAPKPAPKPASKPAPKPSQKPAPEPGRLPDDIPALQRAADQALNEVDLPRAEDLLERLEALIVEEKGPESPDLTGAWLGRARLHELAGRPADAAALYERILNVWVALLGPDHPEVERIGVALADAYLDAGEYSLAEDYLWRALGMRQARIGNNHPGAQRLVASLAFTFLRRGDAGRARTMATQAVAVIDRHLDPDHPLRAWPATVAGLAAAAAKDDRAARGHFEAAMAATRGADQTPDPELVRGYAALLRRAGAEAEARALEASARGPAQ